VERAFAWLLFNRRLRRDYERLCATSETWMYLAMSRLMVRRLVRMHAFPTGLSSSLRNVVSMYNEIKTSLQPAEHRGGETWSSYHTISLVSSR
jgi:hypothetical protein